MSLRPTTFAFGLAFVALAAFAPTATAAAGDDVFAAYQRLMDSRFASDVVATSGDDTTTTHLEYDTIRRIHMKGDRMEVIAVPEGLWMRAGERWTKSPIDLGGMMDRFIPQSIEEMKAGVRDVRDEGGASVDGKPVRVFAFDTDTRVMGIHVTGHNRVSIGADGRIVRIESDGEAMGRNTHTVQTIRYDDAIRVAAPD
jgi:hypothetical protein